MKPTLVLLVALTGVVAACGHELTAPGSPQPAGTAAAALNGGGGQFGAPGFGFLGRLPANLALTDAQKTQIKGYVTAFQAANKSDLDALRALFQQARQARQNGSTPDQVKAILEQGAPIRQRLQTARQQLRQQIEGVLTADQKAWLAANTPKRCDPATAPRLSDAQKAQIKSLRDAFAQANKSDLDAVKAAFQQARQARKNGATADSVKAILATVKPQLQRLATARQTLQSNIQAVLTPEQKASGCFVGPPGMFRPGMGRGIGHGMGAGMGPAFRRIGPGTTGA
ncbi:MAG TPA: Spy/CpxP family protein refolding chaperone [Longimicrobiales bacterium]